MTDCIECGDPLPEHRDDVCAGCFDLNIRQNCTESDDAPPRRKPQSPLGKALYEFSYEVDRVERQASGEARVWITGTAEDLEERVSVEYGDNDE